jgi:pimeloyl-ACP methyl ester carboxylesterase
MGPDGTEEAARVSQIISVDGIDVHVEGAGTDTIVMVHGWPDTYRLWDGTVAHFKDRYRCVRFTLPGFDEDKPRRAYELHELVDFLRHVIEAVSPGRKVILMLHDWGAPFGYQLYCTHPELVARVVGIDVGDARSTERDLDVRGKLAIVGYQVYLAVAWMIGGRFGDRMTQRMAAAMRRPASMRHVSACMDYPYYLTWFGGRRSYRRHFKPFNPDVPMLYVYARRKPVHFQSQAWLDALLQREGNQVEGFDCGHWIMLQQPQRFHELVDGWLSKTA